VISPAPLQPLVPSLPRATRSRWLVAAFVLWAAAVAAGFWGLWSYASIPGVSEGAPHVWPTESSVPRTPGRWTLVMFVHPKCPCTRASLAELERLQAQSPQIDLRVVALLPEGAGSDWNDSPLCRRASLLPGAIAIADAADCEVQRFRVRTSGETLLYDPAGRLAFQGGITLARGHEGDNAGANAILALVSGSSAPATCPVFGCSLFRNHPPGREANP
jgi:hypothetical protein